MRAKTHPGAEEHVQTSSSGETMKTEKLGRGFDGGNKGANKELEPTGLTAGEIADQSAYADDEADVAHQAGPPDRDHKTGK